MNIENMKEAANFIMDLMLNDDSVSEEDKLVTRIIKAYHRISSDLQKITSHFVSGIRTDEELEAKKNTLDYLNLVAGGLEQYMQDIGIGRDHQ